VKRHLRGLDGLRGLAALSVLFYHVSVFAPPPAGSWVADVASVGWVGVDVFFAISGFILFLPFVRASEGLAPKVRVRRYAANRVRRIMPAYLFNLFSLVSLGVATLSLDARGLAIMAGNLTFSARYLGLPLVNGVYWTLICEVAFYVVLPLLAVLLVRRRWVLGLPLLLAVAIAYKWWCVSRFGPPLERSDLRTAFEAFPGVLDQFLMGMVVALLWVSFEKRGRPLAAGAALALSAAGLGGLVGLLVVLQKGVGPTQYWAGSGTLGWAPLILLKPLLSLSAGILLLGVCMRDTPVTNLLDLRPLRFLGSVSFGVYLWHLPLTKLLAKGAPHADHPLRHFALTLGLVLIMSVVWATVSYLFVEQRFLRRRASLPTTDEDLENPRAADATGERPLTTAGLLG
jgi:peptidoglycan/LPS O-acetylase OafA/YrhL